MRRISLLLCAIWCLSWGIMAQTMVTIDAPETWSRNELAAYRGQTITFTTPFYVCNNYGGLTISPRRIFSPTNQALPASPEYQSIISANNTGTVTLTGVSGYHRMGERIDNLTVYVNSTQQVQARGAVQFVGNTRADLEAGYPSVDMVGTHRLLICAFNLEYYIVENIGTGFGPDDAAASAKQHAKIMDALLHIEADIFGFVEVEQGQAALQKLAESLTKATGKPYTWVNDGGSAYGSYTKSGYVYRTDKVETVGGIRQNNTVVQRRKMMQAFREKATNETFIFSLNHFKAKSGTGTGENADQGDGQGIFNADRVKEAYSVLAEYQKNKSYFADEDILIMGDLNAYGKEDPIMVLVDGGMTDLHRYFHQDSSYSYVFHGQAGYLDHALANSTLFPQITGMQAYHINSDESDSYTYDKSNDQSMFRSSDHDPVLVGLALGEVLSMPIVETDFEACKVHLSSEQLHIISAKGGYYRLYDIMGNLLQTGAITSEEEEVAVHAKRAFYIVQVFVEGRVKTFSIVGY